MQQLEQIQDYLKTTSKGPYLGGQQPSAADMALGPKLYHSTVALKHFKVCLNSHSAWGISIDCSMLHQIIMLVATAQGPSRAAVVKVK